MPNLTQCDCKNFNSPNETRQFKDHGKLELVNFSDGSGVGRGTFAPGWKWSNDVKPLAETSSCEADHHGYCLSGSMVIKMNDGNEVRIKAGDVFMIPPGHDAWVDGNEPCVMIDFTGFQTYAKPAAESSAA
jgi:mannose-6-phosphate isomerase-like protein (cupin superfamily)